MPINSPNIFCYDVVVEPVASIASSDSFDVIGDILPIAGVNCKTNQFTTGILDEYSGATAAYSLRRLSSSYNGPAIRVRRQFDLDYHDIGFLENGDLDTQTMLDLSEGTKALFVNNFYDQSGNGFDAQTAQTFGPRIVNSNGTLVFLNQKVSMVFDGTNDEVLATNLLTEFDNTDFLVSVVYGESGGVLNLSLGSESSVPRLYLQDKRFAYNDLSNITFSASTGQNNMQFQVNGASQEAFRNNVSVGQSTLAQVDFNATDFLLGRSGATFMDGKLQEVIIWTDNQTSNRIGIYQNQNSYWL